MRTPHLPLDILYRFFLTFWETQHLFVASAAGVTAASAIGMTLSAGAGTVVLTAFFNGFSQADNAQARRTGTFHLGYGSHFCVLLVGGCLYLYLNIYSYICQGDVKKLLQNQCRSP
jgi:hypothetical protein